MFPSYAEVFRTHKIGDLYSLKDWLKGKIVTKGMVNASKSNYFSLSDIGKNTNDMGWYYVPTELPNNAT